MEKVKLWGYALEGMEREIISKCSFITNSALLNEHNIKDLSADINNYLQALEEYRALSLDSGLDIE